MAGINKVILVGNLGSDPEVRATASGTKVASVNLATSESFNDRNGQRQDRTEWHKLVIWAKSAEIAERYLKKGMQIYVEGRLQTRSWDDQNGQKRYTTEVVVQTFQMLGRREGGQGGQGDNGYAQQQEPSYSQSYGNDSGPSRQGGYGASSGGFQQGGPSGPGNDSPPLPEDDLPF